MAICKLCGVKGFFLKLSSEGLCQRCSIVCSSTVADSVRIINDSLGIIKSSKNLDTILSRIDLVRDRATLMLPYEEKDIATMTPLPSLIISESYNLEIKAIEKYMENTSAEAMLKSKAAKTTKTKIAPLVKALVKIKERERHVLSSQFINNYAKPIEELISNLQLSEHLEKARLAEFKNQTKKALDYYYNALYFIRHDDISDENQAREIDAIEKKILELGGELK